MTDERPTIADRSPTNVDLTAGETYWWCTCGRSASQPFCDGSHAGTGFSPLEFSPEEDGSRALCRCKHTSNPPYCDGSHSSLPAEGDGEDATPQASGGSGAADAPPAPRNTDEEPTLELVHALATRGVEGHGPSAAMGVPRAELPGWADIQLLPAQLATRPLEDDHPVDLEVVIGPRAARPLHISMPIMVSDMSFGAISAEAKVALARGSAAAGTATCSGEGGSLDAERAANERYLFELGSGEFGMTDEVLSSIAAFHFKGGQAAKTGVGGHLPASKVTPEIAEVRGVEPGTAVVSPAAFADLRTPGDFAELAGRVREASGGVPIGFKLSANRLEEDLAFVLEAGADYVIVDGRGGGTGAAPTFVRDNISLPLMAAIPRARRFLDAHGASDVTLVATGGIRLPDEVYKALALGADAVAVANAAIQAAGCVGARICNTNQCPAGIATQDPELRRRLDVDLAAERVERFLRASASVVAMLARACGHERIADAHPGELTSWKLDTARLAGIRHAGLAAD